MVFRLVATAVLIYALLGALGDRFLPENTAPAFLTVPVERGSIATLVKASGAVEAMITVDVSSQLSGRIADVFVSFNDIVKVGQPIAQIDQEIFIARVNEASAALKVAKANAQVQKAAVERAKVAAVNAHTAKRLAEAQSAAIKVKLEEAEKEFQRKSLLARTGTATEQELTHVRALRDMFTADLRACIEQIQMRAEAITITEAERQMAEASLENAQAVVEERQAGLYQAHVDLDHTVIRAPIDGIIIKRDVNSGQTVAVSLEAKTLFKIANDLRLMEVHGKIDEADVRKSPEIVQNVVTYTVIISAPNPDLLLLPGMTAQLRIVVSELGDIVKIPNQALRYRPSNAAAPSNRPAPDQVGSLTSGTVWVVGDHGQPAPVAVKLGASDQSGAELLEGPLREGQQLIVGGTNSQEQTGYFGIRLGL
jgi:HlyD family secretion protein